VCYSQPEEKDPVTVKVETIGNDTLGEAPSASTSESSVKDIRTSSMKELLPLELRARLKEANFNTNRRVSELQDNILSSLYRNPISITPLGYALRHNDRKFAETLIPFVEEIKAHDLNHLPRTIGAFSWLLSIKEVSEELFLKQIGNIVDKFASDYGVYGFLSESPQEFMLKMHRSFHQHAVKYTTSFPSLLHLSEATFNKIIAIVEQKLVKSFPARFTLPLNMKLINLNQFSLSSDYHVTPMQRFIENGDLEAVQELHRLGTSITYKHNVHADSFLKVAVSYGHAHIVEYFLQQGLCADMEDLINLRNHALKESKWSQPLTFLNIRIPFGRTEAFNNMLRILDEHRQKLEA
jgi:hypothetical protein